MSAADGGVTLSPPKDWRAQVDALLVHHGAVGEKDSHLSAALANLIESWQTPDVEVPEALVHVWERNHRSDPAQWGPTEAQVELAWFMDEDEDTPSLVGPAGVQQVQDLIEAAWSLSVEQQHHHSPGWSMSKQWAGAAVRRAFEPFLTAEGDEFDWDKVLRACHRGGTNAQAMQAAADLVYPLRWEHREGQGSGPDTFYAGVIAARVALLEAAKAAAQTVPVDPEAALDVHDLAGASREDLVAHVLRLHSWDGLMELLDEHWPADIFPTLPDTESRDPGPRIVSLLRWLDAAVADPALAPGHVKA